MVASFFDIRGGVGTFVFNQMRKTQQSILSELPILALTDDGPIHFHFLHLCVITRLHYFLRVATHDCDFSLVPAVEEVILSASCQCVSLRDG